MWKLNVHNLVPDGGFSSQSQGYIVSVASPCIAKTVEAIPPIAKYSPRDKSPFLNVLKRVSVCFKTPVKTVFAQRIAHLGILNKKQHSLPKSSVQQCKRK